MLTVKTYSYTGYGLQKVLSKALERDLQQYRSTTIVEP